VIEEGGAGPASNQDRRSGGPTDWVQFTDLHRHLFEGGVRQAVRPQTPITAADLLNDRVVPFFDEHGIAVSRILTDRGTEYCGTPERHEYELYLAVEDIDHSRTKAKSPQTNGICERFHKTVLDAFYRVAFRKHIYETIGELQADLDASSGTMVLRQDADADLP
jgi:hypothetical protein